MSESSRNRAYIAAIVVLAVTLTVLVASSPAPGDRVESIGSQIRCPVCQGESIANSPSQMARDMMDLVRERIAAGLDDAEIIEELLSSYSGAVLLDPPASGSTLILWLAPFVALLVGGAVIALWRANKQIPSPEEGQEPKKRSLIPIVGLALAFAAVVAIAGSFLQERDGIASGVASLDQEDLDSVSNETLEAVIAANLEHPEIDGMRLALAGRYFSEGEYGSALDHYLTVAESPNASQSEVVIALIQMGRLVWDGNAETDVALSLFDQALALDPGSSVALYHKAVVVWCGLEDSAQAGELFAGVLTGDPPESIFEAASADLDAIERGEACA